MRNPSSNIQAVKWENGECVLLDQTKIPAEETYLNCKSFEEVADAIRILAVRGAPAIGVSGAYGVVLAAKQSMGQSTTKERMEYFKNALQVVRTARPTAVNLAWAVDRMSGLVSSEIDDEVISKLESEAKAIDEENVQFSQKMGEHGISVLPDKPTSVITYCNTGALGCCGIGTAFGVIHAGFLNNKIDHVYPCETRPVLQGLRLTAWELAKNNIPFTVICDAMAASVMRDREIGAIFVGADRIAGNGDAANKIGTYALAVAAKHHGVPFYFVAPSSTFDLSLSSGSEIPIEERDPEEIFSVLGENRPKESWPAFNPSFDVTPTDLISGIVCERGVIRAPYAENIKKTLG